jgi:hypothetical protein
VTAYAQSAWYAESLRWIASLVSFAAPALEPTHRELPPEAMPSEDSLDDIRHRVQNRYY